MWLLFHTHKCGGTTIVQLMKANKKKFYMEHGNGNPRENGREIELWKREYGGMRHFMNHCRQNRVQFFAAESFVLNVDWLPECKTILTLRDPWKRFVSHYTQYSIAHPISSERFLHGMQNFITRYLTPNTKSKQMYKPTPNDMKTSSVPTEEDITQAKAFIDKVHYLVILEYPASYNNLRPFFPRFDVSAKNVRGVKPNLEHLREQFMEMNKADYEIYNYAVEKFKTHGR